MEPAHFSSVVAGTRREDLLIYAAETFAGALLEILVHSNLGRVPKTHAAIEISIPDRVSVENFEGLNLPKWDAEDQIASRAFGDEWLSTRRTEH